MVEDEFEHNVYVPPTTGNFREYRYAEGDFVEKAQTAAEELRLKRMAALAQKAQLEARQREIAFAMSELQLELDA